METGSLMSRVARLGMIGAVMTAAVQGGVLAEGAWGQTQPQRQPQPQQWQPPKNWDAVQGPIISLEFPGGTMREYVAAVQRAAEKDAVNVLLPAEAAELPLPRIAMKDVTARTALEALQWTFPQGGSHRIEVTPFGHPETGAATFAIAYRNMGPSSPFTGGQPMMPTGVEVFSIRELVDPAEGGAEGIPVEALLTSIEAALSVSNVGTEPELRFHEESGLLILRGAPDHIMIVRGLLKEIRSDAERRRSVARERARREAEERFHEKKLEIEIGLQEKELMAAKDRVARIRQAREQGQAAVEEVREAEMDEARHEARMRMLMVERERPSPGRSAPAPAGADGGPAGEDLAGVIRRLQERVAALEAELTRSKKGQPEPQ